MADKAPSKSGIGADAIPILYARRTDDFVRLRADFWVSAFLRQCDLDGLVAVLRRRGAIEAGAIYVKLDCLDGRAALFGPAPQTAVESDIDRLFIRLHKDEWIDPLGAETRLKREVEFDNDIWIVEVESRDGRVPLDLVAL